jgi:hypothetical protein
MFFPAPASATTACGLAARRGVLAWHEDVRAGSATEPVHGAFYGSIASDPPTPAIEYPLTDDAMIPFRVGKTSAFAANLMGAPRIDDSRTQITFLSGGTFTVCRLPLTDAETVEMLGSVPDATARCRSVAVTDAMSWSPGPSGSGDAYTNRAEGYSAPGCYCAPDAVFAPDACCKGDFVAHRDLLIPWTDETELNETSSVGVDVSQVPEFRSGSTAVALRWSADGSALFAWLHTEMWTFAWNDTGASNPARVGAWTAEDAFGLSVLGPGHAGTPLDWAFTPDGRFFVIATHCELRYVRVDEPGHEFVAIPVDPRVDATNGCRNADLPGFTSMAMCDDELLYVGTQTATSGSAQHMMMELRLDRSVENELKIAAQRPLWPSLHKIESLLVYGQEEDSAAAETSAPTPSAPSTSSASSVSSASSSPAPEESARAWWNRWGPWMMLALALRGLL